MNWQIIVGIIFLIGGIGNITSDFGAFLFGILVGGALFYWGLKKECFSIKKKKRSPQQAHTPAHPANRHPVSNKLSIPQQYIVFDIETTGFSRTDDRIIEIAANKYFKGEQVSTYHTYVNPGRRIPNSITRLTGIKNAVVENAPSITQIESDLLDFFGSDTLVGHNIKAFDIPFLEAQLGCHFDNDIIDTLNLAKQVFPNLPSYKLSVLDQILQLGGLEHHRAGNDIVVNNALLLACADPGKYKGRINNPTVINSIQIEQRNLYPTIDLKSFTPTNPDVIQNTRLTGKCIVFSGELDILPEEAYQIAVDAGAVLKSRVSKKVDYLVLGTVDPRFLDENGMSSKQRTAQELILSGEGKVQIINESEFLYLASTEK